MYPNFFLFSLYWCYRSAVGDMSTTCQGHVNIGGGVSFSPVNLVSRTCQGPVNVGPFGNTIYVDKKYNLKGGREELRTDDTTPTKKNFFSFFFFRFFKTSQYLSPFLPHFPPIFPRPDFQNHLLCCNKATMLKKRGDVLRRGCILFLLKRILFGGIQKGDNKLLMCALKGGGGEMG